MAIKKKNLKQVINPPVNALNNVINNPQQPQQSLSPELLPQSKPNKTIRFNEDKTVTMTLGGQVFNFTPDEYKTYLGSQTNRGGGNATPNIEKAIQATNEQNIKIQLAQNSQKQEIINKLINEEMAKNPQAEPQQLQEGLVQQAQDQQQEKAEFPKMSGKVGTVLGALTPFKKGEPIATVGEGAQNIANAGTKKVAQVYDFVYSLTQGGKGIQQKEAEASWADMKTSINTNLALVNQGIYDYDEILKDIQLAEITNNRLESSVKGWSGKNLRYYLTDGKDVQIQVLINKKTIENWKIAALNAKTQAEVNAAKNKLGV